MESGAGEAGRGDRAGDHRLPLPARHRPGTSKWNQIEHKLFCHITRTWRARPLASHQVIIDTIAATTTAAGLTVTACLDIGRYPLGGTVSDEQMKDLEDRVITRHGFHGDWNYTLLPVPRPAPPAPAPPALPAASPWPETLTHPALTGMTRTDLDALAAALELPSAAAREQRLHLARGKLRARNSGPAAGTLTLTAALSAAIARQRHGMPCRLLGQLLGVDESTISLATCRIAPLMKQQGITITLAGHRIASLDDLRRHAAAAGITLPGPPQPHTTPDSTLQTRDTPQTHVISGRVPGRSFP